MKGKFMIYALSISLLGTGVNWLKFFMGATSSPSGSTFNSRTSPGGGTWGSGTGGTWSGGSGGHK
jgi:hypothetical protein